MIYRTKKVIKNIFILIIIGLAYASLCSVTGLGIPCPVHYFTGLYCPSCGISRMCLALLSLDFQTAFHYNPCLFCLSPLIALLLIINVIQYIKTGHVKHNRFQMFFILFIIIILVVFGILRNLPAFPYLRPPV